MLKISLIAFLCITHTLTVFAQEESSNATIPNITEAIITTEASTNFTYLSTTSSWPNTTDANVTWPNTTDANVTWPNTTDANVTLSSTTISSTFVPTFTTLFPTTTTGTNVSSSFPTSLLPTNVTVPNTTLIFSTSATPSTENSSTSLINVTLPTLTLSTTFDPVLPFAFVFIVYAERIADVLESLRSYFGLVASDLTTIRNPTDQDLADLRAFTSETLAPEALQKTFVIGFSSVSPQATAAGYNFSRMVLREESMPAEISSALELVAPASLTGSTPATTAVPPSPDDKTTVYVLIAVLAVVVFVVVVGLSSYLGYRCWMRSRRAKEEVELDDLDNAEMGQMGQSRRHSVAVSEEGPRPASYAYQDPPTELDEYYV